jgi:hypothetical protein
MKPWNKVKWQKANADLANRPFADLFWNRDEVCVRCGRQHTIANAVHTRLYGYMCVCGSQEWKAAEQWRAVDAPQAGA